MTTTNTSFEHVLHNLQERNKIIDCTKLTMDTIFTTVHRLNSGSPTLLCINTIQTRVNELYQSYAQSMERFNIGIITFVSDYYSIVDRHSDQFHSKYLHMYSDHRSHYNPILATFKKSDKFNVEELIRIFQDHCYDFKRFKFHTDAAHVRRSRERTWLIYQKLSNYIASENIYDMADLLMHEFDSISSSILKLITTDLQKPTQRKAKISKLYFDGEQMEYFTKVQYMIQKFNNIKLEFKMSEEIFDYCECGNIMQVLVGSSEIVCDHCGYIYELKGTVFDDNQFYSQDSTRYKHAGYEPSKHCKSWLERIQARETNTITDQQIEKIEACIKRDGITNKKRLTIEQLRRYLKDTGLTELNEHVALIKRLITGVAPPQLTYAETQDITTSFSKAVKAYNIIRPSNKSNMTYYPYLLHRLIEMHVPDYQKRKSLLSFIHLQGTQTLVQNDQIWLQICNVVPKFTYCPTDRYKYMD